MSESNNPSSPHSESLIDLYPGGGCNVLGSHTDVRPAVVNHLVDHNPEQTLRELLEKHTFGSVAALTASGDLAVEWAMMAARRRDAGRRFKIITLVGSFHGHTLATRAASGDPQLQSELGPLVAGFVHCPVDDRAAIADAIDDQTTAILVQPILTHDGWRMLSAEYLSELRQLADEHQLWLILDETQVPICGSGTFACQETLGVVPDLLLLSAGLTGAPALGAVIAPSAVLDEMPSAVDSLVASCHPLLADRAAETLRSIESDRLLEADAGQIEAITVSFQAYCDDFEFVRDVRQLGRMVAMELDVEASEIQANLRQRGVLVGTAGPHTLLLIPALTLSKDELERANEALVAVFQAVERTPVEM